LNTITVCIPLSSISAVVFISTAVFAFASLSSSPLPLPQPLLRCRLRLCRSLCFVVVFAVAFLVVIPEGDLLLSLSCYCRSCRHTAAQQSVVFVSSNPTKNVISTEAAHGLIVSSAAEKPPHFAFAVAFIFLSVIPQRRI
jgi:hypothetical protein